jgi:hypothetical protein
LQDVRILLGKPLDTAANVTELRANNK